MQQTDLPLPRTFAELRRTRFSELSSEQVPDLEYVEQLASQTTTNIDHWPILDLLAEVPRGDRRAINKVFFAHAEKQKQTRSEIPPEHIAMLAQSGNTIERAKERRIAEIERQCAANAEAAKNSYARYMSYVTNHWDLQKEQMALEQRPSDFVVTETKKILQDGFWGFHSFSGVSLRLETLQDIVMSEKNQAAGIDRRVNLGRYVADLNLEDMLLRVKRHKNNILSRRFYHPYVSEEGNICWGNASDTATKQLSTGQIYDVFSLLSSLLVTYAEGTTPWERLAEFDAKQGQRFNADDRISRPSSDREFCEDCDEERASCDCGDWCSTCDSHYDNCECHHCEQCGESYEEPCETHYCLICSEYTRGTCHCCSNCERTECTCCSICDSTDNESCGCCFECESTHDDCEACRECYEHDGHTRHCSNNPPVAETEAAPF